jgi:hypothetical protein
MKRIAIVADRMTQPALWLIAMLHLALLLGFLGTLLTLH